MNSINDRIVLEAGDYVAKYLQDNLDKQFCYHDYQHTFSVVNAAAIICRAMQTDERMTGVLLVAAWFHDTGYTKQQQEHEMVSASIAEDFLVQRNINTDEINMVKKCILATKYPQQASSLPERIICDADMFHLSSSNLPSLSVKLRAEWEQARRLTYTDMNWYELNIQFLSQHVFQTKWCRENLQEGVLKNMNIFRQKINELDKEITGQANSLKTKKQKVITEPKLERGVETLFRIASGNHMRLSAMADNKAHILLSINSVIISVVLSVLVKSLGTHTYLIIPVILLLLTCIFSLVFAVLTTKPKLSSGVFTAEQINNREVNLLFFGNFHNMNWEAYEWGMKEIMYDKDYLYKSMTKDIYSLGKVLAAKYKFLNVGYKVFMYGLISAIIAFMVSFWWM